jgi:hypothetical protein
MVEEADWEHCARRQQEIDELLIRHGGDDVLKNAGIVVAHEVRRQGTEDLRLQALIDGIERGFHLLRERLLLLRAHGGENAAQILKEIPDKEAALRKRDPFNLPSHFFIKLMERSFEFFKILRKASNSFDLFKVKTETP